MTRLFAGTPFDMPPTCDRCGKLEQECTCPPPPRQLTEPHKQTAKLALEKRKKGKMVTVIRGLPAAENDLPALLAKLKNACGAGGTVKDAEIELQGNQVDRVRQLLAEIGYKVKG